MPQYIAMWSGPRNISTAMMRAWGNRPDTVVCDEPFYAHYLLATNRADHPGYEQIIGAHETDLRKVVAWLTGPIPGGKSIFYQKHMAHHLLPGMATDWVDQFSNCFLIRQPREMLLSLVQFLPSPTLEETGLPQQVQMFESITERRGAAPPVIDATDVLRNPPGMLRALCSSLNVPFCDEMLSWPPGPRETDGVWAPYWYQNTYNSTGFEPHRAKNDTLADKYLPLLDECRALYDRLYQHRLWPERQPLAAHELNALVGQS
jgi:hypothetical protein